MICTAFLLHAFLFFFSFTLLPSLGAVGMQVLMMTLRAADTAPADFSMRGSSDGGMQGRGMTGKRQKESEADRVR